MDMKEEFKARPYLVSYNHTVCGECARETDMVWAYNAADARYQVELSKEGTIPKDTTFRVTEIKPAACLGS